MDLGWNILMEAICGVEVLTAATCIVYLLLVLWTSETAGDRKVIGSAVVYLSIFGFMVFDVLLMYRISPPLYVRINPLLTLSVTMCPVMLYRVVCAITSPSGEDRFRNIHFIAPLIATGVWTVVTSGIPFDVRVDIIRNFARPAAGYEFLSQYFTSMGAHMLAFLLIYAPLSYARLVAYRKTISDTKHPDTRYRLRWLTTVITLSIFFTSPILVMIITGNRMTYLHPIRVVLNSAVDILLLFILTSNLLRKNYPPRSMERIPGGVRRAIPRGLTEAVGATAGKRPSGSAKLTKGRFEDLFRSEKPWLDPSLSLVGLAERMGTNRVLLSGFINRTYGVNFNAYVNRWRLREVERLLKYPKYNRQPLENVIKLAGFGSYDSYRRARAAENASAADGTDNGKEVRNG